MSKKSIKINKTRIRIAIREKNIWLQNRSLTYAHMYNVHVINPRLFLIRVTDTNVYLQFTQVLSRSEKK